MSANQVFPKLLIIRAGIFALHRDCQPSETKGNRRGFGKPGGCPAPRGFQNNFPSACVCPNPDDDVDAQNPVLKIAARVRFCRAFLWDNPGCARGMIRSNPAVSSGQILFQIAGKAFDFTALPLR